MVYILTSILFLIGFFGLLTQRNMIKIIISVSIMESAVNLFLVLVGYRSAGVAPIITNLTTAEDLKVVSVDPFPQAMVITSIVIGLSVLALMVAIALRLYHLYGTYDIDRIIEERRKGGP